MTLSTSAPEQGLIADLPATLAGLWTAITVTHHIAEQLSTGRDPDASPNVDDVAAALAQAAAVLAVSRSEALHPATDLPTSRDLEPNEVLSLVSALASSCIDLAVELLGDEDEPLTPAEVLAVTRAVTALCAARSLSRGGAA